MELINQRIWILLNIDINQS